MAYLFGVDGSNRSGLRADSVAAAFSAGWEPKCGACAHDGAASVSWRIWGEARSRKLRATWRLRLALLASSMARRITPPMALGVTTGSA